MSRKLAQVDPDRNLRVWFLASVLHSWRRYIGTKVRRAYDTADERERIDLLRELQRTFQGWADACEHVIHNPHPKLRRRS